MEIFNIRPVLWRLTHDGNSYDNKKRVGFKYLKSIILYLGFGVVFMHLTLEIKKNTKCFLSIVIFLHNTREETSAEASASLLEVIINY